MKHKTFFLIFTAIFALAVFWVVPNTYSQGCTITITFTGDGGTCSEPVGAGFEIHFWTDGFGIDDFTAYTNASGQITHNFLYCTQGYFLEEVAIDCIYGGCINYFTPNNGNFTTPYECAVPNESCYCDGDHNTSNSTSNEIPIKFNLYQNYPNPFNPTTQIKFDIAKEGFVKISVYNLAGEGVKVLANDTYSQGSYTVEFNASDLPSGVYLYKLETPDYIDIKKMVLIK